jgi:hexosaminidase
MTVEYQFKATFVSGKAGFTGDVTLCNKTDRDLLDIELHFSVACSLDKATIFGGELMSRDGDFHIFKLDGALKKGQSLKMKFVADYYQMIKVSEWPYGEFIKSEGKIIELENKTLFPDMPDVEIPIHQKPTYSIIPKPQMLMEGDGVFNLSETLSVYIENDRVFDVVESLFSKHQVKQTLIRVSELTNADIVFQQSAQEKESAYQLSISETGVCIRAADYNGYLYGAISFLQIIAKADGQLACVEINDYPEFEYRGNHLDVCRHFFDVQTIKKYIELTAFYKMNYFHWHLTDDEGWRIEIKSYPELTQKGAWRGLDEVLPPQMGTGSSRYGGFYSQDDIKEVVKYAAEFGVTVIPEIDVPGHCRAAIKSLPDLLVDSTDESDYISIQSYSDNVLSPALDETYKFIYAVLDEVCDLFPSEWVHVGSDEVPDGAWLKSELCHEKRELLALESKEKLHGHFLREVEKHLEEKGRKMAGWEEVRTGELASNSTRVYSWQGVEAGRVAAKAGHSVVMTPAQYTYLDLSHTMQEADLGYCWAGSIDLEKAYNYEPIDQALEKQYHKNIVGVQACLWTEVVEDEKRIGLMVLPRLQAIAEVAWSAKKNKDYSDFYLRVVEHKAYLDNMSWSMRPQSWGW